jgi:hypothetical protein
MQLFKVFDFHLGLGKDDDFLISVVFNVVLKMFGFLAFTAADHGVVRDVNGDLVGVVSNQVKKDWVLKLPCHELLDEAWHSCRENHASSILLHTFLNLDDVLFESHVEHFVSLVKNLVLDIIQL